MWSLFFALSALFVIFFFSPSLSPLLRQRIVLLSNQLSISKVRRNLLPNHLNRVHEASKLFFSRCKHTQGSLTEKWTERQRMRETQNVVHNHHTIIICCRFYFISSLTVFLLLSSLVVVQEEKNSSFELKEKERERGTINVTKKMTMPMISMSPSLLSRQ